MLGGEGLGVEFPPKCHCKTQLGPELAQVPLICLHCLESWRVARVPLKQGWEVKFLTGELGAS